MRTKRVFSGVDDMFLFKKGFFSCDDGMFKTVMAVPVYDKVENGR